MNWKLILQLSLFGLAMGIATVFLIPGRIEPPIWLVILAISAYVIAVRAPGASFLYGLLVGLANSVWVTASHILLVNSYISNHPREAAMMASGPLPNSPRLMMALTGPVIGLLSGVVLGLLAIGANKLVPRRAGPGGPGASAL